MGCAYSIKLVNKQLIFWTFSLKNGHFWPENGQKMVFYSKKITYFCGPTYGPKLDEYPDDLAWLIL